MAAGELRPSRGRALVAMTALRLLLLLLAAGCRGHLFVSELISSVTLSPTFKAKLASAGSVSATYGVSFPLELELAGSAAGDRRALLRTAEEALARAGVDGPACVRRAQCEAAGDVARHGLLGQVLQLLLR